MSKEGFTEARHLVVNSWSQISGHLPDGFPSDHLKFLRQYFRAQMRFASGKEVKGKRIMRGLIKKEGYDEFEQEHESFLAAVDLAVRGSTRWDAPPAFRLNNTK